MSKSIAIERWSGRAWYPVLCSPFKNMSIVRKYLKDYCWHFTAENPYRMIDYKPKKQPKYHAPKRNVFHDWNSDKGMVVQIGSTKKVPEFRK